MSKLLSLIRRAPKRASAVIAMIAAAVIVPAALLAYGPERPTFTGAHPAPYVTFDSITDNPDVGDERNFVRIKDASDTSAYGENVNVQAGHTYQVMVYYHNDASSSLNASGVGIAHDVMLRMQMEASVAANQSTDVTGFITSPYANPTQVYDNATLTNQTAGTMDLSFVAGSAKVTSNGAVNGQTLPDSVFSTGTPLGYDALDGTIRGCNQYAGYVIFDVKANQPNFTVTKQVRKSGESTWNKSETVNPGDSVDYLITYKNTGTTQQNNVVIDDTLPAGVTYTPGSTYVVNTTNPNGLNLDAKSDTITKGGVNIGNYGPGGAAYVKFSAKVPANNDLSTCGTNTLTNKVEAETPNGNKGDTADITVNKECQQPPVYTCDALTANLVSGTTYKLDGKASASNGASIVSYTYDFGDGKTQTVTTSGTSSSATHEYPTTGGTYTAKLSVTFNVNGSNKTISGDKCTAQVTIPKPVTPVYTCDALTKSFVSGTTYKFNGSASATGGASIVSYAFDFGDNHNQVVTTSNGTASATHEYPTTGGTYNATLTVTFKVNNGTKTTTSDKCTTTVTISTPETPVYTCDALTKTLVSSKDSTDTYSFDGSASAGNGATITGYTLNFGDGKQYTGATVANVTHDYAQDGKTYTATLSATVQVNGQTKTVSSADCAVSLTTTPPVQECKPGIPVGDTRCNETPECKPGIPMGDTRCEQTPPTTPPVLPQTGASDSIAPILGAGSLIAAISYYVASRRGLLGAIKR